MPGCLAFKAWESGTSKVKMTCHGIFGCYTPILSSAMVAGEPGRKHLLSRPISRPSGVPVSRYGRVFSGIHKLGLRVTWVIGCIECSDAGVMHLSGILPPQKCTRVCSHGSNWKERECPCQPSAPSSLQLRMNMWSIYVCAGNYDQRHAMRHPSTHVPFPAHLRAAVDSRIPSLSAAC
jgi:hypothetical protein